MIHIDPLVHHVIEGESLFLSVETHFPLDKADIQGTWSYTTMSDTKSKTLVSFTKENLITNMEYVDRLIFSKSNFSSEIKNLQRDDEGDYHLSLNIKLHNQTGPIIKEEKTVLVTVDGKSDVSQALQYVSPNFNCKK